MSTGTPAARQFLAGLDALLAPEGIEPTDPAVWERLPQARLVTSLRGTLCRFEFEGDDELWIVLQVRPTAHLLLRPEDRLSRFLDRMGLGREVKVGEPDFDDRYRVQHISKADARVLFDRSVRKMVADLEPFFVLEMAERELRLLKQVDLAEYTPARALEDLERLWDLHSTTMRIELPDAGL